MSDLRNARNALTRIVTGQNIGNVTEVPAAKAFVVTDFAPNVVSIFRLLRAMDQPDAGSSTTSGKTIAIQMKHAKAVEAALTLNAHFAPVRGSPQRAPPVNPPQGAPRITADARTNQLLVSGSPSQVEAVTAAIQKIDVPVHHAKVVSQTVQLIRLAHIRADEAAMALSQLFMGALMVQPASMAAVARPSIVPHDQTNSLLISASDTQVATIRALVTEMDQSQVEKK